MTEFEIAVHDWTVPTRSADIGLSLNGGCVFADFDWRDDGRLGLVRISFDRWGCYETPNAPALPEEATATLVSHVENDTVNNETVRSILVSYFSNEKVVPWREPLADHELLRES